MIYEHKKNRVLLDLRNIDAWRQIGENNFNKESKVCKDNGNKQRVRLGINKRKQEYALRNSLAYLQD